MPLHSNDMYQDMYAEYEEGKASQSFIFTTSNSAYAPLTRDKIEPPRKFSSFTIMRLILALLSLLLIAISLINMGRLDNIWPFLGACNALIVNGLFYFLIKYVQQRTTLRNTRLFKALGFLLALILVILSPYGGPSVLRAYLITWIITIFCVGGLFTLIRQKPIVYRFKHNDPDSSK